MPTQINSYLGWDDEEVKDFSAPMHEFRDRDIEDALLLFVCPECGEQLYCKWVSMDFERSQETSYLKDFDFPSHQISDFGKWREYLYKVWDNVREDACNTIKNFRCPVCGNTHLSFAPGYFMFSAKNFDSDLVYFISKGLSDIGDPTIPDLGNRAQTKFIFDEMDEVILSEKMTYTSSKPWKIRKYSGNCAWDDNQVYSDNKVAFDYLVNDLKQPVKYDVGGLYKLDRRWWHCVVYIYFHKDNLVPLGVVEDDDLYKNIVFIIGMGDAFNLMKKYREIKSLHHNEKIILEQQKDDEKKALSSCIRKNAPKLSVDQITDYLYQLVSIESGIYELTQRYPRLAYTAEEYDFYVRQTVNANTEKGAVDEAKEEVVSAQKSLEEENRRTYQDYMTEIERPEPDYLQEPVKPEKPSEPEYGIPTLFNKKKVAQENSRLKELYESNLSTWNLAMQQYETNMNMVLIENNKRKQDAEHKWEEMQRKEKAKAEQKALDIKKEKKAAFEQSIQNLKKAEIALNDRLKWVEDNRKNCFADERDQAKELLTKLTEAKVQLLNLEIVYKKYNTLAAYATFYDYFKSGRCTTLEGANGAYNLYETELRQDIIIDKLDTMISSLEEIKKNQFMLYTQMKESKKTLDDLNDSMNKVSQTLISTNKQLENVERISMLSAYNTAATAYYAKKNAELTNALGFMLALK